MEDACACDPDLRRAPIGGAMVQVLVSFERPGWDRALFDSARIKPPRILDRQNALRPQKIPIAALRRSGPRARRVHAGSTR